MGKGLAGIRGPGGSHPNTPHSHKVGQADKPPPHLTLISGFLEAIKWLQKCKALKTQGLLFSAYMNYMYALGSVTFPGNVESVLLPSASNQMASK